MEPPFTHYTTGKKTINTTTLMYVLERTKDAAEGLRTKEDLILEVDLDKEEMAYTGLEYILNITPRLKSLEIEFRRKESDNLVTSKHMRLLANYLSTNKSIRTLNILDSPSITSILNKNDDQPMQILAHAINESNLQYLGLNAPLYILNPLFDILSTNTTLQRLTLTDYHGFGSHCWTLRLDSCILGSNIAELLLTFHIESYYIAPIVNILSNSNLKILKLKYSGNPEEKLAQIGEAIATNKSLTKLSIIQTTLQYTDDILYKVLSAVNSHPAIESFTYQINYRSQEFRCIADYLLENNNNRLHTLKLKKNLADLVDPADWKYFAEKFATNTTVKHLFLGKINFRGEVNDPTFLNALKSNTTLVTLDLYPKGVIYTKGVIELLQYDTALTALAVREIKVTDLTGFYNAIMKNSNLTSLDISNMTYNEDKKKVVKFISDLIVNNTRLKELKCSGIPAKRQKNPALTIENILPSLKNNQTLTSLDLFSQYKEQNTKKTESELKIIADVFSSNTTLVKFNTGFESYIIRNRQYYVDAVILWLNIVRAEERVLFPNEIWQRILEHVSMFSLAMKATIARKKEQNNN